MFLKTSSFNGDLSKWDVSRVTYMQGMFEGALSFNGDLSKWDVSKVTTMEKMFYLATSFNGDLSKWDVSRVTNMFRMFREASAFNGDISKWDVSMATNMHGMFHGASAFNGDLSKWGVSRVAHMERMFEQASSFNQTLCGKWNTSTANKYYMLNNSPGKLCASTTSVADELLYTGACATGTYLSTVYKQPSVQACSAKAREYKSSKPVTHFTYAADDGQCAFYADCTGGGDPRKRFSTYKLNIGSEEAATTTTTTKIPTAAPATTAAPPRTTAAPATTAAPPHWHLAAAGAHICDFGISATKDQCDYAVHTLAKAAGKTPNRTLQVGPGGWLCG